jgi:hypothetical protein
MSRKPISVVKNVLSQNCSGLIPPPGTHIDDDNKDSWCDWAPFGELLVFSSFLKLQNDLDTHVISKIFSVHALYM